jgi:DNA-binding winged helix-turn-helix (wHTH) protein
MTPLVESHSKVTFGHFEAHLQNGELWKAGKRIKIQSQPFKVLVALLEHPGEVVSKEELQLRLRGKDTTVDFDRSLGNAINKLRDALSDSSDNPRFIQTLSRRGYRFIAPVGYPPDPLKETSNLTIIPTPFPVDDPGAADAFAVAGPVPVPEATPPASSASLPRGRKWPLLYVCGAVIAVVSAFSFGILLGHSHAADAPLRITQITHNGRISPGRAFDGEPAFDRDRRSAHLCFGH